MRRRISSEFERRVGEATAELRGRLDWLAFLAEASRTLSASLDYNTTLEQVARLAVPRLADACIVDVVQPDGTVHRLPIVHATPHRAMLAQAIEQLGPPKLDGPGAAARVLRTGEPFIVSEVTEAALRASARSEEHLELLRASELRSSIVLPLSARGTILGALTLITTRDSERTFSDADLPLVEELARRSAVAIDNARLYRESRLATEARQKERDWLQQVLDTLPDGVLITDAVGQRVLINAACIALAGAGSSEDDLQNYRTWDVRRPDGSPVPPESLPLMRSLRGEIVHGERLLIRNPASEDDVPILASSVPLGEASGSMTGAVAVFQDVSAVVDLQRQKDKVLTAVSHDLKSPLTNIKVRAQVLQRRIAELPEPQARELEPSVRAIAQAVGRMTALLDELVDVTHLETGRPLDLHLQVLDLVDLVRRAVAERQEWVGQDVVTNLPARPLVGLWDPARLERVLDNLLVNAFKYTPTHGKVFVNVGYEDDSAGGWAVVRVRDEGVGIPPDELPRIFERFYRASNVAGHIGGTGLGLAGTRDIVLQHGGTIDLDSSEGNGTTVTVRLPLRARAAFRTSVTGL